MGRNKSEFKVIKGGRLDRVVLKRSGSVSKRGVGKKGYGKSGGVVGKTRGNIFVYGVILLALIGLASWVTGNTTSQTAKMTMTDRIEKTMEEKYGLVDVRVVSAPLAKNAKDVELTGTWYVSSEDKMYVYMRDDTKEKHALYEMGAEVKPELAKK